MSLPTPAILLLIATLLPLLSFVVLLLIGRRLGTPLAGWFATVMLSAAFVCSGLAMMSWIGGGSERGVEWGAEKLPVVRTWNWIPVGSWATQLEGHHGYLCVGIYADSLTVVLFAMITLVAALVHLFSIGYMRDDARFAKFFTYLGLFSFSMLGLVLSATLLQIFIFWELVGLCSYLLIGFWYERPAASHAAVKAFVVNRIGDVGLLFGLGILFYHLGNLTLTDLWIRLGRAGLGGPIGLPDGTLISAGALTAAGIGLFFGAAGKSAQFPLHVWLADAMEGPTPVSALIHAATMVAAGVYLVGRIFPILTPDAKLFIAIIGAITMTMGSLIAVAQSDIKKVLAFSTLSQLGLMMLAMGVGSWVGGLFHLITHAFFKSLLFLGAGSVIHAAGHEQELPQYGGLIRKMPVTAATFFLAVLAISGTPMLSGAFSKDLILSQAGAFVSLARSRGGQPAGYVLLFAVPVIVTYLTSFYMMRCWMLTFWGKPRNAELFENARESPLLYAPLLLLAVFSIVSGYRWFPVQSMIDDAREEITRYCTTTAPFAGFDTAWPGRSEGAESADTAGDAEAAGVPRSPAAAALADGAEMMRRYAGWAFAIGLLAAAIWYWRGYATSEFLRRFSPLRALHAWLHGRMYFDELYFSVFVAITTGLSAMAVALDRYVVDGAVNALALAVRTGASASGLADRYVVDGAVGAVARFSQDIGSAARAPQNGRIRLYVTLLVLAVAAGAVVLMLVRAYQ